jgi:predicted aconitase with swiveling domain
MTRSFQGRSILAGALEGEAIVSRIGFNTYACYSTSIHVPVKQALCADRSNSDLFGKDLTERILCLPKSVGSTSSGAVWLRVAMRGIAPKALLFSQDIDSVAAGGLIVADVWGDYRIVVIDRLGEDFLGSVHEGDRVEVHRDGHVTVG